ncbi:MAG: helix-turn-helix transcriptional regulator [Bacteroidia bacterium]|nr:helix-turn-helix transcriptional regulator [Bacteroidia bacterium]
MKDRITKIMREEQITPAKFADILGVQRSSISHYLSGRNNPSLDFIQRILLKFKYINPEWLLFGKGEMYKHQAPNTNKIDLNSENQINETAQTSLDLNLTDQASKESDILKNKEDIQPVISKQPDEKQRIIEKIVIFYSNNTFKEFIPS